MNTKKENQTNGRTEKLPADLPPGSLRESKFKGSSYLIALICLLAVFFWLGYHFCRSISADKPEPATQTLAVDNKEPAADEKKLVAVTEKQTEAYTEYETLLETGQPEEEPEEEEEPENWKTVIFGDVGTGIYSSQISVSGLTEKEKELTGFKESSFVKSAAYFLDANGIRTGQITFKDSVDCSSEEAVAYKADLKGYPEKQITVIFYPEYPGEFLFTLEEAYKKQEEVQAVQTEADVQSETPGAQRQSETQVQTSDYDASKFSIYEIPGELLNYIDNQYMLQYRLYDFVYKNYSDAKSAAVTDYEIDGDNRKATIYFKLDSGEAVTGVYELDSKSYRFS